MLKNHLKFDIVIVIILINILIFILEEYLFSKVDDKYEFKIGSGNFLNIFLSFFRHRDVYHLLGNMITFYFTSKSITEKFINSNRIFIMIYVLSGFFGSYFEIYIYNFLNIQWQSEVTQIKKENEYLNCSFVFCEYINKKTGILAEYVYSAWNFEKVLVLNTLQKMEIKGSDSCIYGLIGTELVRKIYGEENLIKDLKIYFNKIKIQFKNKKYFKTSKEIILMIYEIFGFLTVIFDILSKFYNVPWNINYLLNSFISYNIIHNCHIGGAVAGFIISYLYVKNKLPFKKFVNINEYN